MSVDVNDNVTAQLDMADAEPNLEHIKWLLAEHEEKISQLRNQADEIRAQERSAVAEEVRQKIVEYNLMPADLGFSSAPRKPAKDKRAQVAPKYRGPNGETWSGRGRMPRWAVQVRFGGGNLDDYKVQANRAAMEYVARHAIAPQEDPLPGPPPAPVIGLAADIGGSNA